MILNGLSGSGLAEKLGHCCGSSKWREELMKLQPFVDLNDLIEKSNQVWYTLDEKDWVEAFAHHPRIGDLENLRQKFGQHEIWSKGEQATVNRADESILIRLKEQNDAYYDRFGFIFIVFATGKSAEEMLGILESRISNSPEEELVIAAREQNKITRLRLSKLVSSENK